MSKFRNTVIQAPVSDVRSVVNDDGKIGVIVAAGDAHIALEFSAKDAQKLFDGLKAAIQKIEATRPTARTAISGTKTKI